MDNDACKQSSDATVLKSLTERAWRYLARREHSARELRTKLKQHAPSSVIEQVIDRLQERGEQSDSRFAEMLCRTRFSGGKGPIKLLHELQQHQIDDEIISAVMSEYEDRWIDLARQVRLKKFGDTSPKDPREWNRQARFLQQRGFSTSHFERYQG